MDGSGNASGVFNVEPLPTHGRSLTLIY